MKIGTFARNFTLEITHEFQSLAFLKPTLRRKSEILCLKSRDFNCSVPVRYVPKKQSRNGNSENPPPEKASEENSSKKSTEHSGLKFEVPYNYGSFPTHIFSNEKSKKPSRKSINHLMLNDAGPDLEEIDQNLETSESELMEEPDDVDEEFNIHDSNCTGYIIEAGKSKQDAEKLAVELLATRAYTAAELRKKLLGKKIPPAIVDGVVKSFQIRGFINDSLYAETFSRSRWSSSTWGPKRIKHALFKKGISNADAEKAVKVVFEEDEDDGDQKSRLGMSKSSIDHLIVQASKRWLRGCDVPRETRKSRIIRWLQYRGFNWDVITFVIKKLESHHSP